MGKYQKFTSTCVKCGSDKFKPKEMKYIEVEGASYLHYEDTIKEQVICDVCGLEDYVTNLVLKATLVIE